MVMTSLEPAPARAVPVSSLGLTTSSIPTSRNTWALAFCCLQFGQADEEICTKVGCKGLVRGCCVPSSCCAGSAGGGAAGAARAAGSAPPERHGARIAVRGRNELSGTECSVRRRSRVALAGQLGEVVREMPERRPEAFLTLDLSSEGEGAPTCYGFAV